MNHRDDVIAHIAGTSMSSTRMLLDRVNNLNRLRHSLTDLSGPVARLAAALVDRCQQLAGEIDALEAEIGKLAAELAPG